MDFLHPTKKRKKLIKLFIGYGLMGIALASATFLIVVRTLGYDYDRTTGQIIKKSLLIVDAHPESAEVILDGVSRGITNTRIEVIAGEHNIELRRPGYRSWQHSFNLEGSSIEQVVYPFLFPEKLETSSIGKYASGLTMASQSPDRRWLVVSLPDRFAQFQIIDLNDEDNPTENISLPADTVTPASGDHTFTAIEWASDNKHLLVKHNWQNGNEFIVINRDRPLESINLSKLFPNQTATKVVFRDKKFNQFYFFNQQTSTVVAVNSTSRVVNPLLRNVVDFKPYLNDTIVYVGGNTSSKENVEIHLWKNENDYLIRNIPASDKYLIEIAEFDGDLYMATGSSADGRVYVYRNPLFDLTRKPARTPNPFRVLIVKDAYFVSFSANSRFIAVQGGSRFAVYDAETGRQFRHDTSLNLPKKQEAKWMDGHRLIAVNQDKLVVFDFDNTNQRTLDKAFAGFPPVFNRDYDALFSFVPQSDKSFNLMRTELRVLPEGESR